MVVVGKQFLLFEYCGLVVEIPTETKPRPPDTLPLIESWVTLPT